MFVVGLSLHAAEGVVDDAAQVRTRLSEAIDSIDGTISDLRHYIFGLRSPVKGGWAIESLERPPSENKALVQYHFLAEVIP